VQSEKILVINYSSPEINHLAGALAQAGALAGYVRPYANQGRPWERTIAAIPGLASLYRHTFGRRILPPGLLPQHVFETAIAADIASAGLRSYFGKAGKSLSEHLHWHIQRRIAAVGAKHAAAAKIVVASYVVAQPAFEHTSGLRVLNYPIAHHRYIQRFVAEEAEREPEFAQTLPDWTVVPPWVEPQLDAECELADTILVGSSFARNSFIAEGIPDNKLLIVPYGANVSAFRPDEAVARSTDRPFRCLFVGQIGQRKGISYLLRAYRAFRGAGTQLTLIGNFHGDGAAFTPYRDIFEHVPHLPQAALADQYRQADVFVFPSLIEGLGLVVLEAMASGLPVITTPNGPGDIVRDGIDGFVVPIRDVDGIVEKLEFLRANPERRLEMGRNARQRALEYTWTAYRQRTLRLLLGPAEDSVDNDSLTKEVQTHGH